MSVHTRKRLRVPRVGQANRSFAGNMVVVFFLLLLSAFMVFPLIYTISNAFKPLSELFLFPPQFFVRNPTLQNFIDLGNVIADSWVPFSRYLFNTVFITVVGTGGHILFSAMAAYALANNKFAGSRFLFQVVVLSLMFSPAVTAVPTYIIMSRLHWIDSPLAVIVPAFCGSQANPEGVLVLYILI